MWTEFSTIGLVGLFASANSILAGLALAARKKSRNLEVRLRFATLLVLVGYLLGVFILVYHGVVGYTGFIRLSHDVAALLFAAVLLDYVRCSIGLTPLRVWLTMPVVIYLLAGLVFGDAFHAVAGVPQLMAVGISYASIAVLTYLYNMRRLQLSGSEINRAINVELLLFLVISVYLIQFLFLLNQESYSLFMAAPVLGGMIISLFFGVFIFAPAAVDFFTRSTNFSYRRGKSVALQAVSNIIEAKELFLDTDLSVAALAQDLGYKTRELSALINQESGCSFYEFINSFRIAKARVMLASRAEQRTSIDAIALLCGFKSRSTFYDAFRRVTGISPGQYRRSRIQQTVESKKVK